MAFLKRVFSADYRRGLAAEAAGEYLEAARAYALAGERAKVAEMHVLAAERPSGQGSRLGPDGRLAELRTAVRWADGAEPAARELRRRIARALIGHVGQGGRDGSISDADRALLREAAALFEGAGDHVGSGECHELAGDEPAAADAYQRAGELERLEAVLAREEARRHAHVRRRELFEECQIHLVAGERDRALTALRECVELDPGGPARKLIDTLEGKLLVAGHVTLRTRGGPEGGTSTLYVGRFPFAIGRDESCEVALREGNVSRRHVEIDESAGRFRLRDLRSKNGTSLAGVPVDGELPLGEDGELGLGTRCSLEFRSEAGTLLLQAVRGLDCGLRIRASRRPFDLAGGVATLRFVDGRPILSAAEGVDLRLNGGRPGARVQLIRGDVIEPARGSGGDDALRWEVC